MASHPERSITPMSEDASHANVRTISITLSDDEEASCGIKLLEGIVREITKLHLGKYDAQAVKRNIHKRVTKDFVIRVEKHVGNGDMVDGAITEVKIYDEVVHKIQEAIDGIKKTIPDTGDAHVVKDHHLHERLTKHLAHWAEKHAGKFDDKPVDEAAPKHRRKLARGAIGKVKEVMHEMHDKHDAIRDRFHEFVAEHTFHEIDEDDSEYGDIAEDSGSDEVLSELYETFDEVLSKLYETFDELYEAITETDRDLFGESHAKFNAETIGDRVPKNKGAEECVIIGLNAMLSTATELVLVSAITGETVDKDIDKTGTKIINDKEKNKLPYDSRKTGTTWRPWSSRS
ncbi:hypothetical protein V8C35DRAFT_276926 [Trichoderma chlorosporum]